MNRMRLWWPIFTFALLVIVASYGSVTYVNQTIDGMVRLIRGNVNSLLAAQELRISYRDLRNHLLRCQIDPNPDRLAEILPLRHRIMGDLSKAEEAAYTETEKILTAKIRNGLELLFQRVDSWIAKGMKPIELGNIQKMMDNEFVKEVLDPNREYLNINTHFIDLTEKEVLEISSFVSKALIFIGSVGSVLGVAGGITLSTWIRRNQKRVHRKLSATARILKKAGGSNSGGLPDSPKRDLLDEVEKSAKAVVEMVRKSELDALRSEQLAKVGQMAAGIAHEIRNPLTSVKVILQGLERRRTQHGRQLSDREWEVMVDEVDRMDSILNGFLDFARPPRLVRKPTNLVELCREALGSIQARANTQNVVLEGPDDSAPIYGEVDAGQIRQVLCNLLINALDAQPHGGRIQIEIGEVVSNSINYLEIWIIDQGIGLPGDLGDAIFDPFTSTRDSGLGLGLSISRRIIEAHQGSIQCRETEGGGATFILRFRPRIINKKLG
jgi:two-component system sensor histidine kinase HydH